jgi:hypothetical protein
MKKESKNIAWTIWLVIAFILAMIGLITSPISLMLYAIFAAIIAFNFKK